MAEPHAHAPRSSSRALGGIVAILLFLLALAAFVVQSSLTQYVQGTLGFRQPFFLLYIAHTSLIVIFPIHLLYLVVTSRRPTTYYVSYLKAAITSRLSSRGGDHSEKTEFPMVQFVGLTFALATGINIPGILWYASVSLSSISDITALWNTNSFWVYVLTVWLYRLKWELRKLGAVLIASIGVLLDVYGGAKASKVTHSTHSLVLQQNRPAAPIIGDILALIASISYALYQVLYKRYAALPNDPEEGAGEDGDTVAPFAYEPLSDASDSTSSLVSGQRHDPPAAAEADPPPFGLYANFLTSCLGLCTAVSLVIGFPVLHWLAVERFRLPPDRPTLLSVIGIASAGVTFNSCFMILLGVWGPVLTSVGSLLTIVLVLITDFLFNHGTITIWSLLGSGMIATAFGVLSLDILHHAK